MTMEQANALLTGGYVLSNPFTSNTLPASQSSAYSEANPEISYSRELPENMYGESSQPTLTSNLFDAGSGVSYGENIPQVPANGNVEALQTDGAPLTVGSSPESRSYSRRSAFLDTNLNSMQALRAAEATQGIVYAGGKHHIVNPNAGEEGQNDFMEISKDDAFAYKGGNMSAEDLKGKYVQALSGTDYSASDLQGDAPDIAEEAKPQAVNAQTPLMNGNEFDPASVMNGAPAETPFPLTDAPAYTDKDRTGRYNRFR